MRKITLSEYNAIPEDYRGIWTVERWDLPDWADLREKHIGKRTMMAYDNGTCLLVEGMGFEIVDDSSWKKTDEVRQEIGCHYLKFYSEQEIKRLAEHNEQFRNELTGYENSQVNVSVMLKKNSGYKNLYLYQWLKEDIMEFLEREEQSRR